MYTEVLGQKPLRIVSLGDDWVMDDALCDYTLGNQPPNYPVPAIIVEYEYGYNLTTGEVCWITMTSGRYDG